MRLAIYVDDVYRREHDVLSTGLSFPLFAAELAKELALVTLLGRLDPAPGRAHHLLPPEVGFVALPHYASLSHPLEVGRGAVATLHRFWRTLGKVDAIWLLGPHPLALLVVPLALLRRRSVVLGVRQNTTEYAAHRHPGNRWAQMAFWLLEFLWRRLARVYPVVVVGPELVDLYASAPQLLDLTISFVGDEHLVSAEQIPQLSYAGQIRILSVGRIDPEKNPLLLADVLARLVGAGLDVRLLVCGEGSLEQRLNERLAELGVADRADLLGYIPVERGLEEIYRSSHVFLHVSWTEGVPQVLFEAFAARLPAVATAVGGVAKIAGDAVILIGPGDADAAAEAVRRIVDESELRARLVTRGVERARAYSRDAQVHRLAEWLQAAVIGGEIKQPRTGFGRLRARAGARRA